MFGYFVALVPCYSRLPNGELELRLGDELVLETTLICVQRKMFSCVVIRFHIPTGDQTVNLNWHFKMNWYLKLHCYASRGLHHLCQMVYISSGEICESEVCRNLHYRLFPSLILFFLLSKSRIRTRFKTHRPSIRQWIAQSVLQNTGLLSVTKNL